MTSPLEKKPGATLTGATGRNLTTEEYHTILSLQAPFGSVSGMIEHRNVPLQDRIVRGHNQRRDW